MQKRKLVTAMRGHRLLKDKRDEMMRQFLILVRESICLRREMEHGLADVVVNFALARAAIRPPLLNTGLLLSDREVSLEIGHKNIMGVLTPALSFRLRNTDSAGVYSYGLSFTTADLDIAVKSFADVLPVMLRLAEVEKACQLMADEIEKTRRRVNALEYMVIPEIQETIKFISMKLDENERSNHVRLMKVKDMLLEQVYHYELP